MATPPRQIQDFLARRKDEESNRSRLLFALDATASRQAIWNEASELQAELFCAAGDNVEVQLVFYRARECKSSSWARDQGTLLALMRKIECAGGWTQIGRVLSHALKEADRHAIRALVFVGDAFEEKLDDMIEVAAMLGKKSVPAFMFHEGREGKHNEEAARAFKEIARLTGGIYAPFDQGSSKQLRELLRTVGQFAIGSDPRLALSQARKALGITWSQR